ncbi:9663_t:CDS:2, partial [Gigaspora rosea]
HFGAFTGNNNEPYTTANTASNHCSEHQKCKTYPALYTKMAKLNLGPNVPKPLKYALCGVPTWKIQRSNILVHGNLPVIAGIRHRVVFFIHATTIKQNRKFGSLFQNKDPDNSDSEIDVGMNNNKKLGHQKNALRRIKNDQKPQSQAHDCERLKIQDKAIS